jgi:hypothetical protein
LIRNASNLPIFSIGRFSGVDKKFSSLIIHIVALANEEPRSAWRTILDSGFFGGNSEQTALRADPISASDSDFQFWRCLLDKVRNYFEQNPND